MRQESLLWRPDLVGMGPLGGVRLQWYEHAIAAAAADQILDQPLSIVIRTLNEWSTLEQLLQDIKNQHYGAETEVIIVDNESADGTPEKARAFGAKVVTLARGDFTYPRSMNMGVAAATHELVYLTVGHARLSNPFLLHAGARHFAHDAKVGGVFAFPFADDRVSLSERLWFGGWLPRKEARSVPRAKIGVLSATSCMIRRSVWEKFGGFDERYETGGEDTALARTMLNQGFKVIDDPALMAHHAHGKRLVPLLREIWHAQKTVSAPQKLHRPGLPQRRDHLTFDEEK